MSLTKMAVTILNFVNEPNQTYQLSYLDFVIVTFPKVLQHFLPHQPIAKSQFALTEFAVLTYTSMCQAQIVATRTVIVTFSSSVIIAAEHAVLIARYKRLTQ